MNNILELNEIRRWFGNGDKRLNVLNGVNLQIKKGEIVALVGASGTGKSTLLYVTGLLDTPNAGHIILNGKACEKMSERERTSARRASLGFVYQAHLLLPDFTALENVMMPQLIAGVSSVQARERALDLLTQMGLKNRIGHRSGELSGGEQQRVAIARALANKPVLLLADEPTGNLDPVTAEGVFAELLSLVRETGLSALIATHNPELAHKMDRRVQLQNGVLKEI